MGIDGKRLFRMFEHMGFNLFIGDIWRTPNPTPYFVHLLEHIGHSGPRRAKLMGIDSNAVVWCAIRKDSIFCVINFTPHCGQTNPAKALVSKECFKSILLSNL